ncbi:transmembrane protein 69-like [Diaphorina citri]|uniref:Transmembrane protein 69-like n=1 Tax=Diaphorina citri TaxID=121845 RepID=A0A1S3DRU8_DIACI|nr:transmembrane protein 69-like [Diaphorina citri]
MAWFQLAYGATILSYLGGIQWGATLPDSSKSLPSYEALGLAVAPQLVAWFSLLLPIPLGLITTSTALTATLAVDLLKQNYPPWFKSLRIFLTMGAVGSLVGTLFGYIVA